MALLNEAVGLWLPIFGIDLLRYLIAGGGGFLVFAVWLDDRLRHRRVHGSFVGRRSNLHDFGWSLSTAVVFSLNGVVLIYLGRAGIVRRYESIDEYGWLWFALSVPVLLVLQDTYFYWTHRAMHHRWLYRWVHREHHVSTNTSALTSYAFSPIEAFVHAAFVGFAWAVLPLHDIAVFLFMICMVLRNVLGHLSLELFPAGFTKSRWTSWSTTATHHGLHHRYPNHHFGLYFTFWDRWMGTTHAAYDEVFERAAGSRALE